MTTDNYLTKLFSKPLSHFDVSNFDGAQFDPQLPKDLIDGMSSTFSGWEFYGRLEYDGTHFVCYVMRYHALVEVMKSDSFEELIVEVRQKWGKD